MASVTTVKHHDHPPEASPGNRIGPDLAFEIPADAHTLAGFLRWEDSETFPQLGRIDFLGGRLFIDMAAAELHSHETLKSALAAAILPLVRGKRLGKVFIEKARYIHSESDSGVEPDLLICLYDSIRSGRLRFVESEKDATRCMLVEGAADLIIEIVSDSSVGKDTKELRRRYYVAGVREYWIVDARGMQMTFDLLTRGEGDWRPSKPDANGDRHSEVLGRRVRIDRTTDPIGLPDYDVLIQE